MSSSQTQAQEMTLSEARDFPGIRVSTMRSAISVGTLRAHKVHDRWVVARADLLRWLGNRKTGRPPTK